MDSLTVEEWRDVVGFEGRYQVSSLGRVRGLIAPNGRPRKTPKELRPTYDDRSARIVFTVKYKSFPRLLNRVVLEAFVGPCPDGMEGSHLDGNHHNNRIDNLCWETHLDNVRRMEAHGTRLRGAGVNNAKLNDELVRLCRLRARQGEKISHIASELGITHGTLSLAIRGITWSHVPMT